MTDNERDLLNQLSDEERGERLARKDAFSLGNEHMDIIINSLLPDSDANNIKLGKIIRDLVAYNVDGTTDLIDNGNEQDNADMTARRLLLADAKRFQDAWLIRSIRNTNNRLGKTKAGEHEEDHATSKPVTYEKDYTEDEGYPELGDVYEFAKLKLGGIPDDEVKEIVRKWYNNMTKNHWQYNGEKIHNWRGVFSKYANQTWLDKANDKR